MVSKANPWKGAPRRERVGPGTNERRLQIQGRRRKQRRRPKNIGGEQSSAVVSGVGGGGVGGGGVARTKEKGKPDNIKLEGDYETS